jgi:hypothetical protein
MMRKILGMSVVAAMLCVASSAFAAPGVSMAWNFCAGEGTGTNIKSFACASNVGTNLLVLSFELPADLAQVSGNELVIDVLSQTATLPAWWDMKNLAPAVRMPVQHCRRQATPCALIGPRAVRRRYRRVCDGYSSVDGQHRSVVDECAPPVRDRAAVAPVRFRI